jgi:hypothetical protein
MSNIDRLIERSAVHEDWQPILRESLLTLDPDYLDSLLRDDDWLPGVDRLLAAFQRDRAGVRYLLIGESPYPRKASANGIAFYDAAVDSLWSEQGLSKAVNRATSLRNLVKTALLAQGLLQRDADGKITQDSIAQLDKRGLIQTLAGLFDGITPATQAHAGSALLARISRMPADPGCPKFAAAHHVVVVGQDCKAGRGHARQPGLRQAGMRASLQYFVHRQSRHAAIVFQTADTEKIGMTDNRSMPLSNFHRSRPCNKKSL